MKRNSNLTQVVAKQIFLWISLIDGFGESPDMEVAVRAGVGIASFFELPLARFKLHSKLSSNTFQNVKLIFFENIFNARF